MAEGAIRTGAVIEQLLARGYVLVESLLDARLLSELNAEVMRASRAREDEIRRLPGYRMGHVKLGLGARNEPLWQRLVETGLVEALTRQFGFGRVMARGNLNLPGSIRQVFHRDGLDGALIVNVPLVDVTDNGPIELVSGPLGARIDTREFVLGGLRRRGVRVSSRVGDVLVRARAGWHRGTENRSAVARAMVGFRLTAGEGAGENGLEQVGFTGEIEFQGNVYPVGLYGRAQERFDAAFPGFSENAKHALRFALNR